MITHRILYDVSNRDGAQIYCSWLDPSPFRPGPNPGPQAGARAYFVLTLVFGLESRVCRRRNKNWYQPPGNPVSCQGLDHNVFETLERFARKIRISSSWATLRGSSGESIQTGKQWFSNFRTHGAAREKVKLCITATNGDALRQLTTDYIKDVR